MYISTWSIELSVWTHRLLELNYENHSQNWIGLISNPEEYFNISKETVLTIYLLHISLILARRIYLRQLEWILLIQLPPWGRINNWSINNFDYMGIMLWLSQINKSDKKSLSLLSQQFIILYALILFFFFFFACCTVRSFTIYFIFVIVPHLRCHTIKCHK